MIRVFPRRTKWTPTDALAFVGDPPIPEMLPPQMPVRVSVTFTWDIAEGQRLLRAWGQHYKDIQIGGPAFGDPGGEFVPGRFIKEGVTFTHRGCTKRCPWCFAWKREGKPRLLEEIKPGYINQDNNLFALDIGRVKDVFAMHAEQKNPAAFRGGLDIDYLTEQHRYLLDEIRWSEAFFACDHKGALKNLERASRILDGISQSKRRCYVMIGYGDETLLEAERRLERVFELGFLPFSQLYQGEDKMVYPREWMRLNKKWSRPAAYKSKPKASAQIDLFDEAV